MHPLQGLEEITLATWAHFFPSRAISGNSHFFELGGDSLAAINMALAVERETGFLIPIGAIYKAPVLSEFVQLISTFEQEEKRPIVTPLNGKGTQIPLFAIAPAIGGVFHYREFAKYLPSDLPCYCLEPRISAVGRHSYNSVEEIAEWKIKAVKDIQAEGPYRLCGYSFGGSIAWEMARQLKAKGESVELLLTYDTIARGKEFFQPRYSDGLLKSVGHILTRLRADRRTYLRHGARLNPVNVGSLIGVKIKYVFKRSLSFFSKKREPSVRSAADIENEVQNHLRRVYDYGTYDGELILLRARKQLVLRRELDYELGWTGRARQGLRIIDVPGDHLTLMSGEPVKEIARHTVHILDGLRAASIERTNDEQCVDQLPFPESSITSPIDRFRAIVRHAAHRNAILDQGVFYTFKELDDYSDALCGWILNLVDESTKGVAVYLENGYPMCAAFLAVLKSGRYYVPLDPEHPEERTTAIIEQSRAGLVITDDSLMEKAQKVFGPSGMKLVTLGQLPSDIPQPVSAIPLHPESPAVILFTSGSTGKPKGVLHNHRSVAYVGWRRGVGIHLKSSDRYLSVYSGAFMGFLNGFYASIQCGSCFCFYRLRQRGIESLAAWLNANKITVFHSVTSIYRNFVNSLDENTVLTTIRSVTPGGEPTRHSDIEQFKRHFPRGTVYYSNLGSSETGSISFEPIYHETEVPHLIPVGIPFPELNLSIRDPAGNVCPPNTEGEICLNTSNLFSGYWQDEEKTREVMTTLPDKSRMYRSGDYGLLLEDGRLVNLGRKDNQVKINGYRIEIPDVESSFMKLSEIAEIAVVAREDETADNALRLFAFYSLRAGHADTDREHIREALLEHLPTPMIPNYLFAMDSLPKNPTGKVDRKLLARIPVHETPCR